MKTLNPFPTMGQCFSKKKYPAESLDIQAQFETTQKQHQHLHLSTGIKKSFKMWLHLWQTIKQNLDEIDTSNVDWKK